MTQIPDRVRRNRLFGAIMSCALLIAPPSVAKAQDALQAETSLSLIPANAGWYSASLDLGQQWDALVKSRAYQQFVRHPWVALGIAQLRAEWEDPDNEELAAVRQWLQQSENEELLKIALAGLREELFLFGDGSAAKLLLLWNRITHAQQLAAMQAGLTGGDAEQAGMRAALETLAEHRDELVVPAFVIGMRAGERAGVQQQLERAEATLRDVLADQPQLIEQLGREMIAGHDFLVWRMQGDLLPWDEMAGEVPDGERLLFERVRAMVSEKTLVVALGTWDEYVLFSVGPDTNHLEQLGAEPLLVNSEELAPLREAANEPIVSISYVSNDLLSALNVANLEQIDNMVNIAETLIDSGGQLVLIPDDLQLELKADIRKLAEAIKESVPDTGAVLSYAFSVPQGYESFTYNWAEQPGVDPTQPLPILQHLGGSPIIGGATRKLYQPEQYEAFARGMRRAEYYADRLAHVYLSGSMLSWFERFQEEGTPLVDRFNRATSDLLLPALADGQVGFVLDADTKARSWHAMMPPAADPLPLPVIGLVFGVSDADKLKEAGAEYLAIAQQALDRLRSAVQDASESGDLPDEAAEQFPEFQLQPPQSRDIEAGTLYWYAFPPHWGLSEELAFSTALSQDYFAVSILPQFTQRLVEEHPLEAFGLLDDRNRELASAGVLHFAELVEAARPWVGYVVALSQGIAPTEAEGDQVVQSLTAQVESLMDIAACFRGAASITYREGNVFITHSISRFEDLADAD